MTEYIDREAALETLFKDDEWVTHAAKSYQKIKAIPAADVAPVKRGEWVAIESSGFADGNPVWETWQCSNCFEEYETDGEPPIYKYCHNCGADMRGMKMDVREKLVELLSEYFDIGDSYAYNLTRVKSAFACGTMGFDDFEEFDEETVEDIAAYLIANGVTVQDVPDTNVGEWISVKDRLPEIYEKEPGWSVTVLFRTIQGHIHSGYRNIGRPQESFYDDDWTPPYWLNESENLSFEEDEITHWQPLPQPPKGE